MMTETHWYEKTEGGRVLCQLCPRECHLTEGTRGFCFVRKNVAGEMVLDTYGKSTGFCIDPIEKKPLNHFMPGTPVLSFGTAGCNLGCKFCQNWDISKSREVARLSDRAMPRDIAAAAKQAGCRSVAFTYNDPVIWAEYAIDTAQACREIGLRSVAVTAGYITEQARGDFFSAMDAANIDLKAFTEEFYFKQTGSHLQPVLDAIEYACNETDCWVELTNLIIPDANDSPDEIGAMCEWILRHVGPNVPIHFTAFHPDFRMTDRDRTNHSTLTTAYEIAKRVGLNYVYVGNVHDRDRQSTFCHGCGALLIERDWHSLGKYALDGNQCTRCGQQVPGVFESKPGTWGAKRQRLRIPTQEQSDLTSIDQVGFEHLTESDQQTILSAAASMIQSTVNGQDAASAIDLLGKLAEATIDGMFITLKRGDTLRGCCGCQGKPVQLGRAMADAATRTARDPRLPPVSPSELPFLNLSASLLGPLRPIGCSGDDRLKAVEVGRHGLVIRRGQLSGLLLPQVATEQGWNASQFLDETCRKAGLPAGTWLSDDASVSLFDGVCFGGPFPTHAIAESPRPGLLSADDLAALKDWVRGNLAALLSGATPMYYANGVSDCDVLGLMLQVIHPTLGNHEWIQLSIKETRPLQSSLFQMTEHAAKWLAGRLPIEQCDIELAVLSDCVHHGKTSDADQRGIDPASRAVVATDGRRWATRFDRKQSSQSLVEAARAMESFLGTVQLYSFQCDFTGDQFAVSVAPQDDASTGRRPAAVAGTFYPADDASRKTQVDQLLSGLQSIEKRSAVAIMVPHAGLRFSGRVAADVWRRVLVPDRVLIIGPKHTRDGADWAIAPHDAWQLGTSTSVAGDLRTAQELCECLPGMKLDRLAHAREHGIEVQLPFMNRFCPYSRLTAIAISGGTREDYQKLADALAAWMGEQAEPPLLVISSDMNHFANDQENRRRDRLALDAVAGGDGMELLRVCESENISMCGQVPAAIVMMTLRNLGAPGQSTEVTYATSAEYGGDPNRVVGYAGVIW